MLFGKKIRELRDEQGVLQRQLAAARFRKAIREYQRLLANGINRKQIQDT